MDPLMVFGLIMIGYIGHLVSDIRAEVRLMNGHLKGLDTETLLNHSDLISEGIRRSNLPTDIAHEISISDLDEKIAFAIKHSDLDRSIADAITQSELDHGIAHALKMELPESIGKSIRNELHEKLSSIDDNVSSIKDR